MVKVAELRRLAATVALFSACSNTTVGVRPAFLAASTDVIDFGTQEIGTTVTRQLTLISKGERPLKLSDPKGDTLGGLFTVRLDKNVVEPSSDTIAHIAFSPTDAGKYETSFVFGNDSENEPQFKLIVKGTGAELDPCKGVVCTTPPPPGCLSSTQSRHHDTAGTCTQGRCVYPNVDSDCSKFGCDDRTGACALDPCLSLACNTPPGAVCLNESSSRSYDPSGSCADGKCGYKPLDTACAWGCNAKSGLCNGDPCIGVSCQTPPPSQCASSSTSRHFSPSGTCAKGICSYGPAEETCTWGCNTATGFCAPDPCLGVTCTKPPNGCFGVQGTCSNGACIYTATNGAICDDGNPCTVNDTCASGVCNGTPKSCSAPPPPACVGSITLARYESLGTCDSQGVCQYGKTLTVCVHGCENGACKGDPCAGGCDDGNPCTIDKCDQIAGCQHTSNDGAACSTNNSVCPQGVCGSSTCQIKSGATCEMTVKGLCDTVTAPGECTSDGSCVLTTIPPQYACPGCQGLCLTCSIFKACIPL